MGGGRREQMKTAVKETQDLKTSKPVSLTGMRYRQGFVKSVFILK